MDEEVKAMGDKAQELYDAAMTTVTTYGLDVVAAIVTLIIGFWIARRVQNFVAALPKRSEKFDQTVANFLASIARYAVIAVTLLAVLERFGVQTTSLVALLGAAGLAIGLALQGTLSNIAAGVMLLIFRPFKVGQFVDIAGHTGVVKEISLFTTDLDTGDNVRIIIPNGSVWGSSIQNFNYHNTRRIQLVYGIDYGDDIDKAIEIISRVVSADERSLKDPDKVVAVTNLGDSSVDIMVRVWCQSGDFWALQWDLLKAVKEAFDKEGINIPYPTTTVLKAD
ncbi:mechanosensitive ion channel [Temperatibacter marinus]|uniref:Small-conductance mechanosensitive channel n=1 Tax=Temperatibacter marinus TaxID=1456591 RepID=A0AA52H7W1_9PROT|nr:mechanosensitive ion channel domain-containing protein [Temperatibacter marinus]WND01491.1 mechanosensitive ion channel [Temperatibacter marinus]